MQNPTIKTKKTVVTLLILMLFSITTFAQVGVNTTTPDASSMLDITATNKGLLIPRIALTGSNDLATIAAPTNSLLVYNTATVTGANAIVPGYYYYETASSSWLKLTTGNGSALQYFAESRDNANPNAAKPVHKFAAIGSEPDIDIAITPKGNGAINAQVADNGTTGGNKRGTFAVDLQMKRVLSNQVASGNYSTIIGGRDNQATAEYSTAMGYKSIASGFRSMATGGSTASGNTATAMGLNNTASGDYSTAIGTTTTASGFGSTALGYLNNATGGQSTAIGGNNTAGGNYSTAMGQYNTAQSYVETALGIYGTIGAGNATSIVAGDRLLNVGNGSSYLNTSDAFTILKNGNTGIGNNTPSEKLVVNNGNVIIANSNTTTNTAGSLKFAEPINSGTNTTTFKAGIQAADINYTLPTTAPTASQVLSSDATGNMSWATPASGSALQYFAESRDNANPNATVPVHKFAAIGTETNIDIALTPKGNGAITAQVADNDFNGGNKRGAGAVDLQTSRNDPDQVASGNYATIIGGYANKASGDYATATGLSNAASGTTATAIGYNNVASGFIATAIGTNNVASGDGSLTMGSFNTASSFAEIALGYYGTNGGGDPDDFVGTDRLLNVGNGRVAMVNGGPSDAFTILKNGNTGLGNSTPSEKLVVNNGNVAIANTNNTAGTLKFAEPSTSGTNTTTFKAGIQAADINYTLPLTAPTASQVLSSDAAGNMSWATPASGSALQYFAESRNTTAPNATVPVHKFAAIGTETNIDIALTPKGYGAITAQTADNTAIGGNKRGENATDLQTIRDSADQVASGFYSAIAGGVGNKASGGISFAMGTGNEALGYSSIAMGYFSKATASQSIAMGFASLATGASSVAIGHVVKALGDESTAMGSSTEASGSNSTAIGYSNKAVGNISTAMGYGNKASSVGETALGINGTIVTGNPNTIIATDRLLNVGNGTFSAPSDAFTILKNGNTGIDNSTPSEKLVVNNGNVLIANSNTTTNAAGTLKFAEPINSGTNTTTFKAGIQAADINYTLPTTSPTASQVLSSDAAGNMSWATPASGSALQYFAESRNTAAPNATVPVHKFAAIGSDTNIDIALTPRGNGAITAQVADNAIAGGNKRGFFAVDLQMNRNSNSQVASGSYSTVIGKGNTASAVYSTAIGQFNTASGAYSTALGGDNNASGYNSTAFGGFNTASGRDSTVMGLYNTAQSNGETALGIYGTTGTGSAATIVATDRLLNVGNGTSSFPSDAFTILKNGNTGIGNNNPVEKLVVNNGNVAIANTNNTAGTLKFAEPSSSGTNTTTFKAGIQATDINYTLPLTAPIASQVLSSDASGNMSWATPASSALQYFAESRNNAAPNATVPVHKFAAIGTETNIDIALTPKGNGAITAQVADGTTTGGDKRGTFAVDLQMKRNLSDRVASGEYATIIGGRDNQASGEYSTAMGYQSTASGFRSMATGRSTAYGNTATAMGLNSIASGDNSTAIGVAANASGFSSTALGSFNEATGGQSTAIGGNNTARGNYSTVMGNFNTAQSYGETALGIFGTTGAGSATSIVATDRLLNVGNGTTGVGNTSDAFTILKNGNTGIGNNTPSEKLVVNNGNVAIANNNNTAGTLKFAEPSTSGTNTTTFKAGIQAADINYMLPLTAPTASQVLSSDAAGNMSWATPASGSALQYFAESRNNTAPNATVPVHKFAAIGTETNIDIALIPKGNGAITTQVADGTTTGGNKRGQFAVDLQFGRENSASQVASGNYSTIVGGYGNTASGLYSTAMGYESAASKVGATAIGISNDASGNYSTAIGSATVASAAGSLAMGQNTIASGLNSTAFGEFNTASGKNSTAMGIANEAQSLGETSLGFFSTTPTTTGNPTTIVPTDRLLNVGNGTAGVYSDALTILKNGNTGIGNSTPSEKLVVNNGNVAIANNNNTAGTLKFAEPSTSGTNTTTFKAGIQAADINYTLPTTAPTASQVLSSDAAGNMSWATPASTALQYFAESRNNAAPNATVPVHKFVAIGTETNIDIALTPKGNGAITAQTADNTVTGGNKRGVFAVDLQTSRAAADQVASGTNATILGGANNKVTSDFGAAIGSSNTVGGLAAIAFGTSNVTTANVATAIGQSNNVSGVNGTAIGQSNTASGSNATAIGNGTTASGSNAVALGQSVTASGQNAIAMGQGNGASGNYSAVTGQSNNATGPWTNASGFQTTATGNAAVAMGYGNSASSFVETALGTQGTIVAGDPNNFVATDRLLNVGNGSSGRSDAFTILKNGNTGIGNSTPSEKLVVNNGNVAIANNNNTAGTLKFAEPSTSGTNTTTFKAGVQAADINYTLPTTAPTASQVLSSDAAGNMSWATPASSALQYFAESRNTAAPNATVPVHKFAAIGTETNIDIALTPKGTGAVTAQVADGTTTGGTKRGANAVDWQTIRSTASNVASGDSSTIVGGQNNTASGKYSTAMGYFNIASGLASTAMGVQATALGNFSTVIGNLSTALGNNSTAIGLNNTAQSAGEVAMGIYGTTGAGNASTIVATDRLLNVGNGTSTATSDAFTILKNGNTGLSTSTPSSTLDVNGTFATATFVGSTATSVTGAYSIYVYTSASGAAVTFPAASSCTNRRYRIVNKTTFSITVSSYKNLVNFPVTALGGQKYIEIVSDGTDWQQIGGN